MVEITAAGRRHGGRNRMRRVYMSSFESGLEVECGYNVLMSPHQ